MSDLALVTGANGHLGSAIVRTLLAHGWQVRGLVRVSSDRSGLVGLDAEIVVGDVLNPESIRRALDGVTALFHCAAPTVVRSSAERQAIIEGVKNVFEAMRAAPSVRKAVYVSSTVTVGVTDNPAAVLDESAHERLRGTAYQEAKWEAEEWVRQYARSANLSVVTVNPSTIIGPGDFRPTPTNRLVVDFLNDAGGIDWLHRLNFKAAPVWFATGFSVVDVEDVARGALLAFERGTPGERYILGGDNITLKDFFTTLAQKVGLPAPWIFLPRPLLLAVAAIMTAIMRHPSISYSLAKVMVGKYAFFSSAKAVSELGYSSRPYSETISRTVEWFLASSLIRPERRKILAAAWGDRQAKKL